MNYVYSVFSTSLTAPSSEPAPATRRRGRFGRLQPELPHKMTHLTPTGRDQPQLTFSPRQFLREESQG